LAVAHFAQETAADGISVIRLDGENDGPLFPAGFDQRGREVGPVLREDSAATATNPPDRPDQHTPPLDSETTFVFADVFADPLAASHPFRALFPDGGPASGPHGAQPADAASGGGSGGSAGTSGPAGSGPFGDGGAGLAGSGAPTAASADGPGL